MKANRQLAFLKRNIPIQNQRLKEVAYKGLRPVLEYCSLVWDPHHKKYIRLVEMVQRRAARFVLGRYSNTFCHRHVTPPSVGDVGASP